MDAVIQNINVGIPKNEMIFFREFEVRDAKDLYLLSLAETVKANYILTGDKDLLVLHKHKQTTILTLTDFFNLHS